jgi:hypothetical protein
MIFIRAKRVRNQESFLFAASQKQMECKDIIFCAYRKRKAVENFEVSIVIFV